MEAWTEVNLVTVRVQDEDVLELVDAIVHDQLAVEIATWFYFWEPELRLRIRWREPERRAEHAATLARILDEWKARRRINDWFEGAHGVPGATYVGEAEQYGADVWPRLQQDWMSGSELAFRLIKLDRTKHLPYPREYYWQRHVHLFTNQLLGSWDAEIEQCLHQALGYLRLAGKGSRRAKRLLRELKEFS
jgi:hypothetical protein